MSVLKKDNCYKCKHKREVPGDAHISCAKPDKNMKGKPHGVKSGWFLYPFLFDPVWKDVECSNWEMNDGSNSKKG